MAETRRFSARRGHLSVRERQGTLYYFKYRKSDGRSATKRGFTSPRAARRERERMVVSAALGEQASTTETFGDFFDGWLQNRRPYLEPGTYLDYETTVASDWPRYGQSG